MKYDVVVRTAEPDLLAAVRVRVQAREVARAWKPALDRVWEFLRANRELVPGHNVFVYHHPAPGDLSMTADFGVQVSRAFESRGDVRCIETPRGLVVETVHVGAYANLGGAHDAILGWCRANGRTVAASSWEIYGDWNPEPELAETTVRYLLA